MISPDGVARLVLLRHGESVWNVLNLFTGWVNVPLSLAGEQEALIKHLDHVSDDASAQLEVPTGLPVVYDLDRDLRPITPGGRRLGPSPGGQCPGANSHGTGAG